MVKHQRRSHQPGGGVVDGFESDEDDEEPCTPGAGMPYGAHPGMMQSHMAMRPAGPQADYFGHNIPLRQHRLGSNVSADYHPHSIQDPNSMMRRMSAHNMGYVSDGPGVSTMHMPAPYMSQVPRSNSYDGGIQNSPSSYSSGSVRSPLTEGYTFAPPPVENASRALHNVSHQQPNMGSFPSAVMSGQHMGMSLPMQHQNSHQGQEQMVVTHGLYSPQHATSGPTVSAFDNAVGLTAFQHQVPIHQQIPYQYGLPLIQSGFKLESDIQTPQQRMMDEM